MSFGLNRLFNSQKIFFFTLLFIFFTAVYARFTELGWHFSHADDAGVAKSILESKEAGNFDPLIVVKEWTYAPVQFFFTYFLINPDQNYRDVLFWARVPSAVFNLLAFFFLFLFYRAKDRHYTGKAVLAFAFMACSWENIVHSKQMHSYAIGVLVSTAMIWLFMHLSNKNNFSLKTMLGVGLILSLLSHMQFQMMFFMPSFFIPLFFYALSKGHRFWPTVRNFFAGGLIYLVTLLPTVYLLIIRRGLMAGSHDWAWGPNLEFFYDPGLYQGLAAKILYTLKFVLKNFLICYDSTLAFIPENHALFSAIAFFLSFLFCMGFAELWISNDKRLRALAAQAGILFVTWTMLVLVHQLDYSPTRHVLILLPIYILLTVEGFAWFLKLPSALFKKKFFSTFQNNLPYFAAAAFILIVFFSNYGIFLEERHDAFTEEAIIKVIEDYDVDSIILLRGTHQAAIMRNMNAAWKKNQEKKQSHGDYHIYQNILWISRQSKMNPLRLGELIDYHNQLARNYYRNFPEIPGQEHPLKKWPYKYSVVFSREVEKDVQIDFSRKTWNGMNAMYLYVLRREDYQASAGR